MITLIAALVSYGAASAAETFTFAGPIDPASSPELFRNQMILTEAFRRLGLELVYKGYPPARSSAMLDAGMIDGDAGRIAGYEQDHPNAVIVAQEFQASTLSAFAKDPAIQLEEWEDLRDTNYRVEYYRGAALAERILTNVVKAGNLSTISTPEQALKKLIAGRTDVYVAFSSTTIPLLESPEFQHSGIRVLDVKEEISIYPYLHRRHADLAPKLADVLRKMKAEGLFEQYMQQAQQEFEQQ